MPYFHSPVTMPEKSEVQIESQEQNDQWDTVQESDSLQNYNRADHLQ